MRRTNVAMTRARRHLALIGDSSTVSREPFINGMISYCQEHGEVCSAHDYINGMFSSKLQNLLLVELTAEMSCSC